MRRSRLVWLAGLAAWLAYGAPTSSAEPSAGPLFILHTEESPPLQFSQDGVVQGLAVEVVRELFRRAQVPYVITLEPWVTAFDSAKKAANHGVFTTVRTPKREASFHWIGPLSVGNWVLYAKKNRHLTLHKLREAFPYKIGARPGDAKAIFLTEAGATISPGDSEADNLQRLERGDIDLWAAGSRTGSWQAEQVGVDDIEEVFTFHEDFGYLAMSKETSLSTVYHLMRILEQMRAEGLLDKLIHVP